MADFEVKLVAGATLTPWKDPVGPNGEPSRVAWRPGFEQLYWLGKVGVQLTFHAVVNLVQAPPDSALGGRLFAAYMPEAPALPPIIDLVAGFSSIITYTPPASGHYVIGIRRPSGGAVLVPFDVGV